MTRVGLLAAITIIGGMVIMPATGQAVRSVRGFDGSTIKVASIGVAAQFAPSAPIGVQARLKRANDSNEIKGINFTYAGFADDKLDPATALSETRRLVTQEQVFAIVGDMSATQPGDYLNQQHVPYFGWAFESSYCSNSLKPNQSLYGFGFDGCLVPNSPKVMPDLGKALYDFVSKKIGKKHPTLSIFSNDTAAGKAGIASGASAYQGIGFNVVYVKGLVPATVSDYTPYVQALLTSNNGKAPDAMVCNLQIDCIQIWQQLKAGGYQGTYKTFLYSDLLIKPMDGALAAINFTNLSGSNPALDQMKKDIDAFKPGTKPDGTMAAAYLSTDMFLSALKKVGKNITPEAVQKAAMHQTWQLKGFAGPTQYPASTVKATSYCEELTQSDGTAWQTVEPMVCSTKGYPVLSKFKG